jgi:hypothetical protein
MGKHHTEDYKLSAVKFLLVAISNKKDVAKNLQGQASD